MRADFRTVASAVKPALSRILFTTLVLLAPALTILAQDEEKAPNARLEGFGRSVKVEGSTGLTWVLFVVLAALCVGVMFKNAKRSHLD